VESITEWIGRKITYR